MVDSNFTDDLDDDQDLDNQEEPGHPANNATVPQGEPKTLTIVVDLTLEERGNAGIRAAEKFDAIQALKEEVAKINARKKLLEKDHATLSKQALTGKAEVAADQVDMFRRPRGEAGEPVGGDAAAQTFTDLAEKAAADLAASEATEPPSWKPEHHHASCPAKAGPLHECNCGWNAAQGAGPVAVPADPFEASEEELAKQSGRKPRGKKAA